MIKQILRVALLCMTLILTLAGSLNLNRAGAQRPPLGGGGGEGDCYSCLGGPFVCRHGPVGQRCYHEYPY